MFGKGESGDEAVSLRTVVLGAGLGFGLLFAAGVAPARAQHLVTDNEAGKLTLDALTATPAPVYRPVYRALHRPAMAMRRAHRPGYVGPPDA